MKRSFLPWIALFFFLSTLFLLRYQIVGQAVYGDGIYYWAYTRSLIIDHDFDLKNEGAHTYGKVTNNSTEKQPQGTNDTDLSQNKYYPLGPSPLWIPPFFLAHLGTKTIIVAGYQITDNGYADTYQIAVGLANVTFVVLGVYLTHKLLRKYYNKFAAAMTAALVLFSTNLLYYGSLDVLNSHPASFFLCSFFTYLFLSHREKVSYPVWLLLGMLLGLIAVVRLQDSLFVLLPLSFILQEVLMRKGKKKGAVSNYLLVFFIGAFIGFFPQLLVSKIIYHTFFLIPYTFGSGQFHLGDNKLLQLFFDSQKGLVAASPVFLIGLVGIFLLQGKMKILKFPFLSVIIASFLLISVWSGWSQGESYGLRMFISLLPLIAFGIAEVITRLSTHFSKAAFVLIGLLFITHNLVLIAAFHLFFHNPTYVGDQISQSGKLKEAILNSLFNLLRR